MLDLGPLLGAAMAVSTSVAFHAIVLSKVKTDGVIDLDSLATFTAFPGSVGRGCADWPQQRSADRRQAYLVDPCRPLSTYSLLPPASAWPAVWFFDPFQRFEV
jgi:hypothetical protein